MSQPLANIQPIIQTPSINHLVSDNHPVSENHNWSNAVIIETSKEVISWNNLGLEIARRFRTDVYNGSLRQQR